MTQANEWTSNGYPLIEELMPHRGPVVLLDRVLRHEKDETDSLIVVSSQRWFVRANGSVANWLTVEYMAQGLAAHEGLVALEQGRPLPLGFLVAASNLRIHVSDYSSSSRLIVRARRVRGRPEMGALSHACQVYSIVSSQDAEDWCTDATRGGVLVAEGRLSVSIPRGGAA